MNRYGFSQQAVSPHAFQDAVKAGRCCIEVLLTNQDDPHGQWGDSPAQRLYRAELSSKFNTVFGNTETIRFATLIPQDWQVIQPGEFVQDGHHPEQCVLWQMHADPKTDDTAALALWVIGDRYVIWFHGKPIWQGQFTSEQWDDWAFDVRWDNDANRGHLNITRNGLVIHAEQWAATLLTATETLYLKCGLYLWTWPPGVTYRRSYIQI